MGLGDCGKREERDQTAEREQPNSSCLGLARRFRKAQQRAVDYFSSQAPLWKDMALFMRIATGA